MVISAARLIAIFVVAARFHSLLTIVRTLLRVIQVLLGDTDILNVVGHSNWLAEFLGKPADCG